MISPPKSPTSPHLPVVEISPTLSMDCPTSGVLVTGEGNIRAAHGSEENVFFVDPESPQPSTSQGLSHGVKSISALPVPTDQDVLELLEQPKGGRKPNTKELEEIDITDAALSYGSCDEAGTSGLVDTPAVTQGAEDIDKPYKCSEEGCGKRFKYASVLTRHQRKHTGDKPFVCQDCGKKFSQQGNLDTHKITHTGEKNHVCNTCGKSFSQRGTLIRHNSTHLDGNPFLCDIEGCSYTAKSSNTLKIHKNRKHKE